MSVEAHKVVEKNAYLAQQLLGFSSTISEQLEDAEMLMLQGAVSHVILCMQVCTSSICERALKERE